MSFEKSFPKTFEKWKRWWKTAEILWKSVKTRGKGSFCAFLFPQGCGKLGIPHEFSTGCGKLSGKTASAEIALGVCEMWSCGKVGDFRFVLQTVGGAEAISE